MYRHLNIAGNPDLINLDRFKLTTDPKKVATVFEFYNGDKWVSLTKQTGKFLTTKILWDRFGGLKAMKIILGTVETLPALESLLKSQLNLQTIRYRNGKCTPGGAFVFSGGYSC